MVLAPKKLVWMLWAYNILSWMQDPAAILSCSGIKCEYCLIGRAARV